MKKIVIGGLMAAVLAFGAAACADSHNDQRGRGDAPVAGRRGDDTPAHCTNMPDQFGNVCAKCIAGFPGWAFAVTTQPSMLAVFRDTETCGGSPLVPTPVPVVATPASKASKSA